MKNTKKVLALALALCMLAALASATAFTGEGFKTVKAKAETALYSIDAKRPVTGYAKLDRAVKNDYAQALKEFKQGAVFEEAEEIQSSLGEDAKSDYQGDYAITGASDKLFSVCMQAYIYNLGAAHGNAVYYTYTYDVEKNKLLELSDIFKEDSGYLDFLSKECAKKIKALFAQRGEDPESYMFMEGFEPNEDSFNLFVLTDKGVTIIFPPYQVAPYAAGTLEAEFTYDELKDYLA